MLEARCRCLLRAAAFAARAFIDARAYEELTPCFSAPFHCLRSRLTCLLFAHACCLEADARHAACMSTLPDDAAARQDVVI